MLNARLHRWLGYFGIVLTLTAAVEAGIFSAQQDHVRLSWAFAAGALSVWWTLRMRDHFIRISGSRMEASFRARAIENLGGEERIEQARLSMVQPHLCTYYCDEYREKHFGGLL